jgi:hypothetical protein
MPLPPLSFHGFMVLGVHFLTNRFRSQSELPVLCPSGTGWGTSYVAPVKRKNIKFIFCKNSRSENPPDFEDTAAGGNVGSKTC